MWTHSAQTVCGYKSVAPDARGAGFHPRPDVLTLDVTDRPRVWEATPWPII